MRALSAQRLLRAGVRLGRSASHGIHRRIDGNKSLTANSKYIVLIVVLLCCITILTSLLFTTTPGGWSGEKLRHMANPSPQAEYLDEDEDHSLHRRFLKTMQSLKSQPHFKVYLGISLSVTICMFALTTIVFTGRWYESCPSRPQRRRVSNSVRFSETNQYHLLPLDEESSYSSLTAVKEEHEEDDDADSAINLECAMSSSMDSLASVEIDAPPIAFHGSR
eukprot:Clim_evm16s139 gene=Clim_evmTU16s139